MALRLFIKFLSKAIYYSKSKTLHICNFLSLWTLSNCCDPLWDTFHIPVIKITYTPQILANFYTGSCAKIFHLSIHFIPQKNKKLHVIHDYSLQVIISRKRTWAVQKEIKNMLKKAWWKKCWTHEGPSIWKKKTRDSPCPKKENGERWFIEGVYTPSIQN